MKPSEVFSHSKTSFLILIWVIWLTPFKLIAQFPTSCVFPSNQATLCNDYGTLVPQIQILTPTQSASWLGNWTNAVIFINAEFKVNTAFSITGCTIRFGTAGRIVITTGGNLNSLNSKYFGCDGWEGIQVEGSGILQFNDNWIEDALYAITIRSSNSQSIITECTFNRNIVDIYVPSAVTANALITGNLFDCSSNTFQGAKSDIGILTQKSTLPFGLPLTDYNFVRNHKIGAHLYSSNVTMRNVDFDCNDEVGIYAKLGRLDLNTDPGFSFTNNFFHNRADIITDATNLFVQLTSFSQCQSNNITSTGNIHAQNVDIKFNTFHINNDNQFAIDHHKSGIMLDRSSGTSGSGAKNKISNNGFYIANFTIDEARSAIRVTGYPGTPDRMTISGNQVEVLAGGSKPSVARSSTLFDIAVNEAFNFDLIENHIKTQNIDHTNNRSRWGFYLHNRQSPSSGHTLLGNTVFSKDGTSDKGMCAFHFQDCGPWSICYNQTDKTLRGFHLRGACGTSEFGANVMGDHRRSTSTNTGATAAMILEQTTVLGPQYCRKNLFTFADYAPDEGAEHRGNPTIVAASRFDIDPTVQQQEPNPTDPITGWFFSTPACTGHPANHCGGQELPPYQSYLDDYEMTTILSNQTYTSPANVNEWDNRRQVYAKLLRYPALSSSSASANTFFNAQTNSSAALYAQWDESVNLAMQMTEEKQSSLETVRLGLSTLVTRLDSLDKTLTTLNEVKAASTYFFNSRHSILSQMGLLQVQEEEIIASIDLVRAIALNNCQASLLYLPQNTQYEVNQAFLNAVLLKYAKKEQLSSGDISTLQSIASQCPDIAGKTRDKAAIWLTPGNLARQVWEDGETPLCDSGDRNAQSKSIQQTEPFRIWPNPVESTVNIGFNFNFSGEIILCTINDQKPILQKECNSVKDVQLHIGSLNAGVYVLIAKSSDGQKFSRKFVVIK
ncbi:MAG: hypothetical protein ACKVT2_07415 [Saprospiraceae bacterium]